MKSFYRIHSSKILDSCHLLSKGDSEDQIGQHILPESAWCSISQKSPQLGKRYILKDFAHNNFLCQRLTLRKKILRFLSEMYSMLMFPPTCSEIPFFWMEICAQEQNFEISKKQSEKIISLTFLFCQSLKVHSFQVLQYLPSEKFVLKRFQNRAPKSLSTQFLMTRCKAYHNHFSSIKSSQN